MIRSALIALDPEKSPGLKSPDHVFAGLPWLVRWIKTASRAGVENFIVTGEMSLEPCKQSLEKVFSGSGIAVSWVHVSQAGVLKQMIQGMGSPQDSWIVAPWNSFIPKTVWPSVQQKATGPFAVLSGEKQTVAVVTDSKGILEKFPGNPETTSTRTYPACRRVVTKEDASQAECRLYQDLIKDTEGFMSRHVERKISFAITHLLVKTPITPNAVSIFNILLGVGSGFLLAVPDRQTQVMGALLFLLTSILDGCDGEIARLKFMESKWGGWLDFLGDNIVHVAVFWGIAVGVWLTDGNPLARTLGAMAVGGTICTALFVFYKSQQQEKAGSGPFFTSVASPETQNSLLVRFSDALTRRDFIYLVVALAALGKLQWFLWMSAIGSPLFFVTLILIYLKESIPGEKTA